MAGPNLMKFKVIELSIAALLTANTGLLAWLALTVINHGERIALIEKAGEDGKAISEKIQAAVSANGSRIALLESSAIPPEERLNLWRELEAIKTRVAGIPLNNDPPRWLTDRLDTLDREIRILRERQGMVRP